MPCNRSTKLYRNTLTKLPFLLRLKKKLKLYKQTPMAQTYLKATEKYQEMDVILQSQKDSLSAKSRVY